MKCNERKLWMRCNKRSNLGSVDLWGVAGDAEKNCGLALFTYDVGNGDGLRQLDLRTQMPDLIATTLQQLTGFRSI
jgi:hypothetical protein